MGARGSAQLSELGVSMHSTHQKNEGGVLMRRAYALVPARQAKSSQELLPRVYGT